MRLPTPLRLATFAASILLRAVLVNHVAAWLQTQGVESAIRAVFMRPFADAPRPMSVAVDLNAARGRNEAPARTHLRYAENTNSLSFCEVWH